MLQTKQLYNFVRKFHTNNALYLTATEMATALRPFYFAVHPDLFGQYPTQRATNENSLKQLSSFLENLQSRKSSTACFLKFYIRNNKQNQGQFRIIKLNLNERDVRQAVLKVLKSCDLPTEYVDKIPQPIKPAENVNRFDFTRVDPDDTIFGPIAVKRKIKEAQEDLRLQNWINANYEDSLKKTKFNQPMHDEIDRLKKTLSERWGLIEVKWDCGWNETHFRGCLQSFSGLADQHPENMHILRGRVIVFAPFTGVSLDGHIMLNSGEVRHNWLDLIKNVRKYDAHLIRIPAFEKAVSQVLRDIKVVRRKFMPKILAGEYERHLSQITTSLGDYLTYRSFPKIWPNSLKNYELVVETEAGPLMVSPTGQFIVPSTCPGFLLVSFFTDNLKEATERIENYKRNKHVEKSLQLEVINQLSLLNLRKDDNVNPDFMIKCCERLLLNKERISNLKGVHLNIATYYSVLSDGLMCIPWNFNI